MNAYKIYKVEVRNYEEEVKGMRFCKIIYDYVFNSQEEAHDFRDRLQPALKESYEIEITEVRA